MMMVRSRMPGKLLKVVCSAAVDQPVVDLVGDDQQVVAFGHSRDFTHVARLQHGAGGVVGIVEQDRPRARRDRRLDLGARDLEQVSTWVAIGTGVPPAKTTSGSYETKQGSGTITSSPGFRMAVSAR